MKTKHKVLIEHGVRLEAESFAQFSSGGFHPSYKTKKANKKWIQKIFGSNKKANFKGEYRLDLN
jgi:hypothetical protein